MNQTLDRQKTAIIFGLGTIYFLVVLVFGLFNYQSKFIMDGYSLIFQISYDEWFTTAVGRYVMWIPQIFPVFLSMVGASVSTIMQGYVINDLLLFFGSFAFLLWGLKRPYFALLLVGTHALGMYFNHFMMVGELQPGSAFAVMSMAILASWKTAGFGQKLLLVPFLLLTVWSHPLALISFMAAVGLIYLFDRNKHETVAGIKVLVLVAVGMLLLKFAFIEEYDVNSVDRTFRTPTETLAAFMSGPYLIDQFLYLIVSSPVGIALFLINLYHLGKMHTWMQMLALVLFCGLWWFVVNMYVNLSGFNLNLATNMMANRYLFPVQFLVLSVFCLSTLPWLERVWSKARPVYVFCGLWFIGVGFFMVAGRRANRTINEYKTTIDAAREQGLEKSYFPVSDYCRDIYLHSGAFYATYVLSNLDGGPPCHVVHGTPSEIEDLSRLSDDVIYLMREVQSHTGELNTDRFQPLLGPYMQLDYRCTRATLGNP